MDRLKTFEKYAGPGLAIVISAACVLEFILCFVRGYEELWYTILVPSVIVIALACFACFTRRKCLYAVASAILVAGSILLIGFPSYVMYAALILGALSLLTEAVWLILRILWGRKGEDR